MLQWEKARTWISLHSIKEIKAFLNTISVKIINEISKIQGVFKKYQDWSYIYQNRNEQ